ncbi:MAG TPA: hypothetical protein ENO23_11675, partial [Alphaproteobacteria bacterium]|nr:hypothetical protein [Alphaproteobacteria bacterium]
MRPTLQLLEDGLRERIIEEAREILHGIGVRVHNPGVLALLAEHGATVDLAAERASIGGDLVDRALATVRHSFELFDARGARTHDLSERRVHFTPGSAAIHILDHG